MLLHFIEHPGKLVTKDGLAALWPESEVSDAVLTVNIREIRGVLGDDSKKPEFIETVHRKGFRFIGKILEDGFTIVGKSKSVLNNHVAAPHRVGRHAEFTRLHGWLEKALAGERQLVFITGEPGRGKTTLVDGFLDQVARDGKIWMGRGLCIEHYGAGEAYRPIFDAITQLCHAPGRRNLIELLGQYAPTWLVQMPALLDGQEFAALKRKTQGTTPERMLREVTEALETLTAAQPLILVLEDLHWSDGSTLDLLAFLARRRQSARLLVLGTYRPAEMIANDHPLKAVRRELLGQERCQDLPLLPFSEHEVNEYLVQRFMKHTYSKRRERSQMELW